MILIVKNVRGKTKKIKLPKLGQVYLQLENGDMFSLTLYPGEEHSEKRLKIKACTSELSIRPDSINSVYLTQE